MEVCAVSHLSLGTCVGVRAAPALRSLTTTTAVPLLREISQQVCTQLKLLCENRLICISLHTSTLVPRQCVHNNGPVPQSLFCTLY